MKRLVISISILLIAGLCYCPALSGAEDANSQPAAKRKEPAQAAKQAEKQAEKQTQSQAERQMQKRADKRAADVNSTADVNAVSDVNAVAEPNIVKPEWLLKLEDELSKLYTKRTGEEELREWGRGEVERKMSLAELVEARVTAELNLIHDIAADEGAEKTKEAVDCLLTARGKRYEEISQRIEEERRRQRLRDRDDRKGRDRDTRRGRDREERRTRDRERPARRERPKEP